MSDPVNEVKARLLLEELNRRNKWFAILQANRGSSPWAALVPGLFAVFAAILICRSFNSDQAVAIFMLATALWGAMGVHADGVHRRVDALIALLQQESILQSALPASRETPRGEPPVEGAQETSPDKT